MGVSLVADACSAWIVGQIVGPVATLVLLFNPLSIASCLSGSSSTWHATFILAALWYSVRANHHGSLLLAGLCLAVAIALQPLSFLLIPALVLTTGSARSGVYCVLFSVILACLSTLIVGSWVWVEDVLLFPFSSRDNSPNIGLHWYFFLELFPAFESLYRISWMVMMCIPVPAIAVALRKSPIVSWFAVLMIIGVLGPHPSLMDISLAYALLPGIPSVSLLSIPAFFLCICLLVVFWDLWVLSGFGNANFYYGSTVAGAISNMYLLLDAINSERVRLYKLEKKIE